MFRVLLISLFIVKYITNMSISNTLIKNQTNKL